MVALLGQWCGSKYHLEHRVGFKREGHEVSLPRFPHLAFKTKETATHLPHSLSDKSRVLL